METLSKVLSDLGMIGLIVAGGVAILGFLLVFLLAAPGKEISYFGIKFEKKIKPAKKPKPPKPSSYKFTGEWKVVLSAFVALDDDEIHEWNIIDWAVTQKMSRLATKRCLGEMWDAGLISTSFNPHHWKLLKPGMSETTRLTVTDDERQTVKSRIAARHQAAQNRI